MNPLIQFKKATPLFLVAFGLACFGLSPAAQAVSPAPDGGYPGGNTAEGQSALLSLTTGTYNTAVGFSSLRSNATGRFNTAIGASTLFANTADQNTAIGFGALFHNTTGFENTAEGTLALLNNTTGTQNTANGFQALISNTTGGSNTANGAFALFNNTTGLATAIGKGALFSNTTGRHNTANGLNALFSNTTGNFNTTNGDGALYGNATGSDNVANGYFALVSNTTGVDNTANGVDALLSNTTGGFNMADGALALLSNTTGGSNTAIGSTALENDTTGGSNTALGFGAGFGVATASNVICIGNLVSGVDVSNSCFIGNIRGVTTQNADAIPVLVDSANQLGTMSSSRRFKKEIKPMDKASESILALKPVTFHYKSDTKDTPQFGLIAEDAAAVNPDLVVYDNNGEIYTVRYDAVNAMLLNEFLKEHSTVHELKNEVAALTATVKEQAAQIQKVSAQLAAASPSGGGLGASKPAPQVVLNNQ